MDIFGAAAQTYITTAVCFSLTKRFHVCSEAKKSEEYFYPGRRLGVLFYLIPVVLLPYVFFPEKPETFRLVRLYYPLTHFYYCGSLLLDYFSTVKKRERHHRTTIVSSVLVFSLLSLLILTCFVDIPLVSQYLETAVLAAAVLMTAYCIMSMLTVRRFVQEIIDDNYSNPDDFPLDYARRCLIIPVFHALIIWPSVVFESREYVAAEQFVLSVFNIVFLIYTLTPMRRAFADEPEKNEPEKSETEKSETKTVRQEKVIDEIRGYVEGHKAFLNPHLTIADVAGNCVFGRSVISRVLTAEFGGFYNYINGLRLDYYEQYTASHPEDTKETAALQSGFNSRQAYYNAKKKLER